MPDSLLLLVALIAVALIFDFLNGLHDAANSIATVVSTRVLSPNVAVIWAAFFNFIALILMLAPCGSVAAEFARLSGPAKVPTVNSASAKSTPAKELFWCRNRTCGTHIASYRHLCPRLPFGCRGTSH
jgi:hypothetical protein